MSEEHLTPEYMTGQIFTLCIAFASLAREAGVKSEAFKAIDEMKRIFEREAERSPSAYQKGRLSVLRSILQEL